MAAEAPAAGRAAPRTGDTFAPLLGHAARTIRLSTAAWIAAFVLVAAVVVATYESAYRTEPERRALAAQIEGNPSFEALFGPARDIDTVGGFAVWRINGVAVLLAGVWALLATARLTRGEEDGGYAEHVRGGAVGRAAPLAAALVTVGAGAAVLFAAVSGVVLALGVEARDAVLVGGPQALFALTMAAVTALVAQLVDSRGRTLAIAGGVLAAAYFARVIATGMDVGWLAWATPVGWANLLGHEARLAPVLPFALLLPSLVAAAVVLAGRRDLGAGALGYGGGEIRPGRPVPSAEALARRLTVPAALGWGAGIGAYGLLIGLLASDMLEFLRESPGIQELFAQLGLTTLDRAEGVLGFGFGVFAFLLALAAAQQVSGIAEEEASGRAETLLVRPLGRSRWLGGRVAAAVAALAAIAAVTGAATWVGVVARGETVDAWRLALASANLLPPAVLFLGLGVAVFGLRPRAAPGAAWGLVVGSFLVEFVGSVLELPEGVLALSPFHHLEPAPAVDPAAGPAILMVAGGVAATLVGLAAFRRRDVVGD